MTAFFSAMAVLLAWVAFIAVAKHEQGWVGLSKARLAEIRLRVAMHRMMIAIGEAFLPVVTRATKAMAEWNRSMRAAGWHFIGEAGDWDNIRG